ncbi:MAG: iron-containing alcohol dehydrogenase [Spirochaetales bacterium]|nr:iron-containing alcohol dehydrogenase [Spirochaetales bacterium]
MDLRDKAKQLLKDWKGDSYTFGLGVLNEIGTVAKGFGSKALVVSEDMFKDINDRVLASLKEAGVSVVPDYIVNGAKPNAPREDVYRLESCILHFQPDSLIVIGGGSGIDAVKAANVLYTLGAANSPEIEEYFGTGMVTEALKRTGKKQLPVIAVQTSASSGAHLTKYSNITDPVEGQKKLIVDEAVVPQAPLFDYEVTTTMPMGLTIDGALDGIAHSLEVFFGCKDDKYEQVKEIAAAAIELVVENTKKVVDNPKDAEAREALGLATDLGGYAIMVGGTNGAHLTSFSLVDVTSHGRACAIMNPYYAVFFAPAVEKKLKVVGEIFKKHGFIDADLSALSGRELGLAVAEGMKAFSKSVGMPATLSELPGFTDKHIERALKAAKNPQLKMKLQNMPVPLTPELVDEYMGPILQAAKTGDLTIIKNLK